MYCILAPICLASVVEGVVKLPDKAAVAIISILVIPWISLYPISAVVASCIFQRNLLALAKLQAASTRDITKMIELTERQQTLVAVAAYVLYTIYCCLHEY